MQPSMLAKLGLLETGPLTKHDVNLLTRAGIGLKVIGSGKFCIYHFCGPIIGCKKHITLRRFETGKERLAFALERIPYSPFREPMDVINGDTLDGLHTGFVDLCAVQSCDYAPAWKFVEL